MTTAALFLSPEAGLYLGPVPVVRRHRNTVPSFVFHVEPGRDMRVRARPGEEVRAPVVYVPPGAWHDPVEPDSPTGVLYLEPGTGACARVRARFGGYGAARVTAWHPDERWQRGLSFFRDAPHAEGGVRAVEQLLACVGAPRAAPLGPRVLSLLHQLRTHLGEDVAPSLSRWAATAEVSASRLSHLVASELGIGPRRLQLWLRLRRAIFAAMQGASLTESAHDAGFFDSAHFSRAFRGAFGITPSSVLLPGEGLRLVTHGSAAELPPTFMGP